MIYQKEIVSTKQYIFTKIIFIYLYTSGRHRYRAFIINQDRTARTNIKKKNNSSDYEYLVKRKLVKKYP